MTRKHLILMAIGCLLPLLVLGASLLFQIPISRMALYGLFLLCPVMHLLMMRDHLGHKNQPTPQQHEDMM